MSLIRVHCGCLLSVCLFLAAGTAFAQQPSTAPASNAEAAALMQEAESFEGAGNFSRAATAYRSIVRRFLHILGQRVRRHRVPRRGRLNVSTSHVLGLALIEIGRAHV
jgi:hypothetical protein